MYSHSSLCTLLRSYAWSRPSSVGWRISGRRGVFVVNTITCTYAYHRTHWLKKKVLHLLSALGCLTCQTKSNKKGNKSNLFGTLRVIDQQGKFPTKLPSLKLIASLLLKMDGTGRRSGFLLGFDLFSGVNLLLVFRVGVNLILKVPKLIFCIFDETRKNVHGDFFGELTTMRKQFRG